MLNILVVIPVEQRHKDYLEQKSGGKGVFTYCAPECVTLAAVKAADVIIGNVAPELLKEAEKLKWLQLNSAGADQYIKEGILPEGVYLTNATGAYGLAISEHMLGVVLQLQKKLHLYRDNQRECQWQDEGSVTSIFASTTLVVGLGDIGSEFAARMKALGSHTIGIRRNKASKPDFIDELYTMEALDEVLPKADIVALSLPNTKATYHLFNEERFKKMKSGALLINVGRGTAIDSFALKDAVENGWIGGAGLDVTEPEPLPADHPLWQVKNVIITPHISGQYHLQETFERIVRIAGENLTAFLAGQPLRNQVDFETGYRKFVQ